MYNIANVTMCVCVCKRGCSALLEVHKQVLKQRDDCYIESETLQRSATPR